MVLDYVADSFRCLISLLEDELKCTNDENEIKSIKYQIAELRKSLKERENHLIKEVNLDAKVPETK